MRGFWHIVDAVIACILLIGFIVVIGRVLVAPPEDLNMKAYEVLKGLDDQGILKNYTVNLDTAGLNSHVGIYSHNHSIRICDYSGSCTGATPQARNIYAGNYIIAGKDSYQPYIVKLYLW